MAAPWRVEVDEEEIDGAEGRLEVAVVQVYHLPVARKLLGGGGSGEGREQEREEEEEERKRRRRRRRSHGRARPIRSSAASEREGVVLVPKELSVCLDGRRGLLGKSSFMPLLLLKKRNANSHLMSHVGLSFFFLS